MKTLTLTLFSALLILPTSSWAESKVIRLSEPVQSTSGYEDFGAPLPDGSSPLSLQDLVADAENYADKDVLLNTRVAKVCQKKGCFFIASEGALSARISFKDYSFFIPTDSGGKQVTLAGRFSRSQVSQAQADHFAEDLGGDAPADPAAYAYSFVASSVRIPR